MFLTIFTVNLQRVREVRSKVNFVPGTPLPGAGMARSADLDRELGILIDIPHPQSCGFSCGSNN